jgi:translation elongation factor EF-1beta
MPERNMGEVVCLSKKAIVEICLVPQSKKVNNKQIVKEIKQSLTCDWLATVEKVTVTIEP